jgi:hypothetical protein
LPPSSRLTFFSVPLAAATMRLPTAVEPVKDTMSTDRVRRQRRAHRVAEAQHDVDDARGTPASCRSSPRITVLDGVSSDGFTTAVQPAASAKGSFWLTIRNGKFQGQMIPATPIGSFRTSPSMSGPSELWLSPCIVRAKARGIAPEVRRAFDLAPRLADRLARFQRFDQGDPLDVAFDQVGDLQEDRRPVLARRARPVARVETRRAAAMAASVSAFRPWPRRSPDHAMGGRLPLGRRAVALSVHAPSIRWRAVNGSAGRAAPLAGMIVKLMSSSLELRFAFFREGRDALGLVLGRRDHAAAQRLDHRARSSPTPAWIWYLATSWARGAAFSSPWQCPSPPPRVLRHLGHEAQRKRPLRRQPPPEQRHFLQHRLRQQPRKPLRPRPARHDADLRLGQAQRGLGAITRMSQAVASSSPPPNACPCMTATVGRDSRASRSKTRWPSRTQCRANSVGLSAPQPMMSAPRRRRAPPPP